MRGAVEQSGLKAVRSAKNGRGCGGEEVASRAEHRLQTPGSRASHKKANRAATVRKLMNKFGDAARQ